MISTFLCKLWLIKFDCVPVLSAVTSSKEEEAKWTKEETLQDSQQPFGRGPGGLFRWCSCEEIILFPKTSSHVGDVSL